MKKISFLSLFVVVAFLLSACASSGIAFGGKIEKMSRNTEYVTADIKYPSFNGYDDVNKRIAYIVTENLALFEETAKTNMADIEGKGDSWGKAEYVVLCSDIVNNASYISVVINTYSYLPGAAHGMTNLVSVNYDKTQNKYINIEDIGFSYAEASVLCRKNLAENLSEQEYENIRDMIEAGTAPSAENFSVFYYNGKNLTVFFEPYQVAPYAYGIIEVPLKN